MEVALRALDASAPARPRAAPVVEPATATRLLLITVVLCLFGCGDDGGDVTAPIFGVEVSDDGRTLGVDVSACAHEYAAGGH